MTQPANGTVAITGGGTGLTYTPNQNYCNGGDPTDDFTYTLNGGSTATVAVTVDCADDDPTAVNDAATVAEDSSANPIDVLANDTDRRRPEDDHRGDPARERDRRDHRRRHRAHLHPEPELLQRRRPDRQLHLHPERRLDRDRGGHRRLRR